MPSTMTSACALVDTVERLSSARTLAQVTQVVTEAVRTTLGCDGATFVLREDGNCHYADEDAVSPLWKGSRFPPGSCVSGWAMGHRQTVVIPDIYVDDRVPHDAYRPTFVKSLAMAPIRDTDPIGALGAYWGSGHAADAEEVRLLQVIANSAAVAIENLELRGAIERRSAERDSLSERADELEAAIHTLAHDLRSPLGAMLGYAELLEDAVDDGREESEKARVFARTIGTSGRRMAEQIDTMLALYRITQRVIEPSYVDLSAVARRVANDLVAHRTGPAATRDVDIDVQDDLIAVVDPVLAGLMLENLLGNAVKYTGNKAQARIWLGSVDLPHIGPSGPFTTFVVRDNGDGFSPEDADRLFRPMSRLHSADEFPGTGLGLASVARIVEMHGGQVRAEGEKSVGASFYFSLPTAV
ncbi:GAF domain-containing sensor histidine kinase [Nocardioides rubriscoriae]|uniref:GAF domain-containing sensor histidine kinase n=1 Tax=Nocardioides rubriscoriae TaxID=642762 RepID=UPI0011DFD367|nr:GAF domain-containing sensor histidine kinase [Nocardioides rubriscoriae]